MPTERDYRKAVRVAIHEKFGIVLGLLMRKKFCPITTEERRQVCDVIVPAQSARVTMPTLLDVAFVAVVVHALPTNFVAGCRSCVGKQKRNSDWQHLGARGNDAAADCERFGMRGAVLVLMLVQRCRVTCSCPIDDLSRMRRLPLGDLSA